MELMLVFALADELYGIEVAHLQEIVERPTLHYVPRAPTTLLGAINFHGNVVPVVDLAELLGFPWRESSPRLLVLTPQWHSLGLAVHALRGIVPYQPEQLLPLPAERQDGCIRAVHPGPDGMVNLLDTAQVITMLQTNPLMTVTGGHRWG